MTSEDWTPIRQVSLAEIESSKTPKGGWTYAQFQAWGVPLPPPKGWKVRLTAGTNVLAGECCVAANDALERMLANAKPKLISGSPFGVEGQIDVDPAKLLRKVVTAVINHGQAHILHEFPDVLAFFGARIPQAHAKKVAASESSSDALTKLDQREEA